MISQTATAVGIDVGATNIKILHVNQEGDRLNQFHLPTTERWLEEIKDRLAKLDDTTAVIGVAAPGIPAPDQRSISWMFGKMAGVINVDWAAELHRLGVPVLNDAHAALLGEVWLGAARGARNAIMLTLGTGVGGAVLADGKLLRGHLSRAGHLGHIVVDAAGALDAVNTPGSLEGAIGEYTLPARSGGRFTTTRELLEARQAGDDEAGRIWLSSVRALAAGLTTIINTVDPEIAIIGGGIAQAGAALFGPLEEFMNQFEWRPHGRKVKILPAELGDAAGALGAARYAMNQEST